MGRLPTNTDFPGAVKLSIVPRKYLKVLSNHAKLQWGCLSAATFTHVYFR